MGVSHGEVCVVTAEKRCRLLQKIMFIQCSHRNVFFPVVTSLEALGLRNLNVLQGFLANMYWWLQMNPEAVGFVQLAALTRSWITALLRERAQGRFLLCQHGHASVNEGRTQPVVLCSALGDMGCGKKMDVLPGCKGATCMPVPRALVLLCSSTQKLLENQVT